MSSTAWQVNSLYPDIGRALIVLARNNGYHGSYDNPRTFENNLRAYPFLVFYECEGLNFGGNPYADAQWGELVSIEEAFKRLSVPPKPRYKTIGIGSYEGKIYKDKIVVDCTTVTKEEVEKILEMMKSLS